MRKLTALVNLLAQGKASQAVQPYLAGAGLVALPKPDGGHPPVAVGEVIRRAARKVLSEVCKAEAQARWEPRLDGVGTPGGCEVLSTMSTGKRYCGGAGIDASTHRMAVLDLRP